jgi:hypothetical protein
VREAVHALLGAVRTLRQHAKEPRLGQDAVARCTAAILAATHDFPVSLRLGRGAVCLDDEVLLPFTADEVPFGALAAAGIGEVVLACGIPATMVEQLVATLAAAAVTTNAEYDIAAVLRAADLPGVELLTADRHDRDLEPDPDATAHRPNWWLLPAPGPAALALQSLVERDHDNNLPAIVARLLLADLDDGAGMHNPPSPQLLDGLFATMLQRGDAANAAWLLEQAQHHPAVPAEVALQLRSRAAMACHGPWLVQQLERGDRVQGLVALAMQLGDDSLQKVAAAAVGAGQPLPGWLLEFVPPPA